MAFDPPAAILTKLKTVDGTGSGLDADLLDGEHATAFQDASAVLDLLAALVLAGGALKVIRVNAGETAFELAPVPLTYAPIFRMMGA